MADSARLRRRWDRMSRTYDQRTAWGERRFFAGTRAWVGAHATGDVLAVGTIERLAARKP